MRKVVDEAILPNTFFQNSSASFIKLLMVKLFSKQARFFKDNMSGMVSVAANAAATPPSRRRPARHPSRESTMS